MGSWKIHMISNALLGAILSRATQIKHIYRINKQKQEQTR